MFQNKKNSQSHSERQNWICTTLKLGFLSLFILSCGDGGGPQVVTISVTEKAFLIAEGSITYSTGDPCYPSQTFSAPRFRISKIKTGWFGEGSFRPVLIRITINAGVNNGKHECVLSSSSGSTDSIALALGFPSSVVTSKSDPNNLTESVCSLDCGGVPITDKNKSVFTTATVKLYGIQTQTIDGQEVDQQVTATDTLTLEYTP